MDILAVYFIYGLAFFTLGLALFIYPKKRSEFIFSKDLYLIAAFGVSHGVNEWLDMYLLVSDSLAATYLKFVILPFSYLFLFHFGVKTVMRLKGRSRNLEILTPVLALIWLGVTFTSEDIFLTGEILGRYLVGVPGIFLTAYALALHLPEIRKKGYPGIDRFLEVASGSFLFYGIFSGFVVPQADYFPANVLNFEEFYSLTGVPVQVFRALCAGGAALGMMKTLSIFEWETWSEMERMVEERTAELRELQKLDNMILEFSPVALLLYDRELRVVRVSSAFEVITGYSPREVTGRTPREFMPPSERTEGIVERLEKVREEGISSGPIEVEPSPRSNRYIEERVVPVLGSQNGVSHILVILQDVTEQKKALEALKKSEERFRTLFEMANDGIFILDMNGNILDVNRTAYSRLGYTKEEMLSMNIAQLTTPRFSARVAGRVERVRREGQAVFESSHIGKDGTEMPVEANVREMRFEGRRAFLSIVRDLTQRKKAERELKDYARRLEESNRMKELFGDILRHDLLNPMGIAMTYAHLLQERKEGGEVMERIVRNLSKARQIIEDTRELSRLEDVQSLNRKNLDLREIVEDTLNSYGDVAEKEGVELENRISYPITLRANRVVEEIFSNLISNALKYAKEGRKVVVVGEEVNSSWRVKVRDFGPGIRDEDKEDVFNRFQRRMKKGVRGTGLGLAIARKVAELHSGHIWVEDTPGGGATFVVELPRGEDT